MSTTNLSGTPRPLRLETHRVGRSAEDHEIVCAYSGTSPSPGDIVFQFLNPNGVVRSFRSVRFAEAYVKMNPQEKP